MSSAPSVAPGAADEGLLRFGEHGREIDHDVDLALDLAPKCTPVNVNAATRAPTEHIAPLTEAHRAMQTPDSQQLAAEEAWADEIEASRARPDCRGSGVGTATATSARSWRQQPLPPALRTTMT